MAHDAASQAIQKTGGKAATSPSFPPGLCGSGSKNLLGEANPSWNWISGKTTGPDPQNPGIITGIWRGFCQQDFLALSILFLTFAVLYFGQIYFDTPNHSQIVDFHQLLFFIE